MRDSGDTSNQRLIAGGGGKVDTNRTTINLSAIHRLFDCLSLGDLVEGNKTKATGTTAVAVSDDLGLGDIVKSTKGVAERIIRGSPGQISDKETITFLFSRHDVLWKCMNGRKGFGRFEKVKAEGGDRDSWVRGGRVSSESGATAFVVRKLEKV